MQLHAAAEFALASCPYQHVEKHSGRLYIYTDASTEPSDPETAAWSAVAVHVGQDGALSFQGVLFGKVLETLAFTPVLKSHDSTSPEIVA
eukprot:6778635-Pyramimonas_sp.AAC.1